MFSAVYAHSLNHIYMMFNLSTEASRCLLLQVQRIILTRTVILQDVFMGNKYANKTVAIITAAASYLVCIPNVYQNVSWKVILTFGSTFRASSRDSEICPPLIAISLLSTSSNTARIPNEVFNSTRFTSGQV